MLSAKGHNSRVQILPSISLGKESTYLLQACKYSVLYVHMPSDDVKHEKKE
jgi:hypothetical protein